MTDQIPMRSASERRDAAQPVLMWLGVYADRAREIVTEIEESREADGLEPVIEARDAADDHLSHYVQHIEKQRAVLEALLEVPEVGLTEDELVAEVIAEFERETGMHYPPAVLVGVRNWVARGIRAGERAALEHWEPADVPSQEFMLRHLGIGYRESVNAPGNLFIPTQHIKKEVF
ncbi:hypothetical protein SEA_MASHLEY_84 [Microbacterium phage Mashley]|nr:hypothetical protein SEA_MASHLEY_84 [Microbacterium phage Mashley]